MPFCFPVCPGPYISSEAIQPRVGVLLGSSCCCRPINLMKSPGLQRDTLVFVLAPRHLTTSGQPLGYWAGPDSPSSARQTPLEWSMIPEYTISTLRGKCYGPSGAWMRSNTKPRFPQGYRATRMDMCSKCQWNHKFAGVSDSNPFSFKSFKPFRTRPSMSRVHAKKKSSVIHLITGWWFGCHQFYCPIYWECHHPN